MPINRILIMAANQTLRNNRGTVEHVIHRIIGEWMALHNNSNQSEHGSAGPI